MQRAYILADDELHAEDASVASHHAAPTGTGTTLAIQVGTSISDAERELIQATLEHVDGNKAAAAKILGISLKTLYVRLNLYDAASP